MAYIDFTPDELSRSVATPPPHPERTGRARAVPRGTSARAHRLEALLLGGIILVFTGLVFALAILNIASTGIALIVTALTLLPIVSLLVTSSGATRS